MLVVVVPSLVISSSCARDCVFMTRDMLRVMAQENLMCSSRPTNWLIFSAGRRSEILQSMGSTPSNHVMGARSDGDDIW